MQPINMIMIYYWDKKLKKKMLYRHLLIHAEIYIYMLDTYRRNDNRRSNKRRRNN